MPVRADDDHALALPVAGGERRRDGPRHVFAAAPAEEPRHVPETDAERIFPAGGYDLPVNVMIRPMTRGRVFTARAIAIAADLLQIAVFPAFSEGVASPLAAALDVAVAGLLSFLVGWHWAFLPSFAAELVPFVDLVPTWTAAVLIVTRPSKVRESAGRGSGA